MKMDIETVLTTVSSGECMNAHKAIKMLHWILQQLKKGHFQVDTRFWLCFKALLQVVPPTMLQIRLSFLNCITKALEIGESDVTATISSYSNLLDIVINVV